MLAVDISILVLLAAALVFSIVELGISSYIATISYVVVPVVFTFGPNGVTSPNQDFEWRQWYAPPEVGYLIFCSVWTVLVAPLLIAIPFIRGRFSDRLLGIGTFILNMFNMIIWFIGFIIIACFYGGGVLTGIYAALLAFPILLWLVFTALVVLNFLTGFGVLKSARRGQHPIFQRQRRTVSTASTIAPAEGEVTIEKRKEIEKA